MDIRNSVEGLKTLLGVPPTTLSSAGTEVAQTASESEVRMDKVASVHAALAAGTYNVPASAVAGKVVDAMLGGEQSSGN